MSQRGFLTPAENPGGLMLAPLWLYAGDDWEAIPRGVLAELLHAWNYEALPGDVSIDDTIDAYQNALARTFKHWTYPQPYYARVALLNSKTLLCHWPLWEPPGATLASDLKNAYHLTPVGHTWGVAGVGDGQTSVSLSGSASCIKTAPAALLAAFNPDLGSLSIWAKAANWGATAYYNHFTAYTANPNVMHYVRKDSTTTYTLGIKPPGLAETKVTVSIASWAANSWHHIAATWDANGDMILYLDGVEAGRTAHPGAWGTTRTAQITLGALNQTGAQGHVGPLAHAALWTSVLSAEEIAYLANV